MNEKPIDTNCIFEKNILISYAKVKNKQVQYTYYVPLLPFVQQYCKLSI